MDEEQIAVVDHANRFVRWVPRSQIHRDRLVHRSVYVLVFDDSGRLLIQRRHHDKQTFPRHWDLSCAGHVAATDYPAGPDDDLDTVYRLTAARELAEELGIASPLEELAHVGPIPGVHDEQIRIFRAFHAGPVRLQPEEVEDTRWITRAELASLCADPHARLTASLRYFGPWAQACGHWP